MNSKQIKQLLRWILFNVGYAGLIYLAVDGVDGAIKLLPFYITGIAIITGIGALLLFLGMISVQVGKKPDDKFRQSFYDLKAYPVPFWFRSTFDVGCAMTLFWFGFWYSGTMTFAYIILNWFAHGFIHATIDAIEEINKEKTALEKANA